MRRLPRAFFWVDQQIIRSGTWIKLSPQARLAYIAVSASADREGVSIWSRNKLRELAGCSDTDELARCLAELGEHALVEQLNEQVPPAIRLCNLGKEATDPPSDVAPRPPGGSTAGVSPIVVHTHTTIHLGASNADSGTTV